MIMNKNLMYQYNKNDDYTKSGIILYITIYEVS